MKTFTSLFILSAVLSSTLALTDLGGCTRTAALLADKSGYTTFYWNPEVREQCSILDCGGGRAPPKTNVPGCPLYTGTDPVAVTGWPAEATPYELDAPPAPETPAPTPAPDAPAPPSPTPDAPPAAESPVSDEPAADGEGDAPAQSSTTPSTTPSSSPSRTSGLSTITSAPSASPSASRPASASRVRLLTEVLVLAAAIAFFALA
ncbi:hypothetical protein BKA70DRAFT_1450171 [Coprinopsis sp. MPI-PUGE-AT-0042]|nr:hypothetical protein BKA70DRAFT_1450171 [Coprinopsis sp. MPI-PUGE-AT-0042]